MRVRGICLFLMACAGLCSAGDPWKSANMDIVYKTVDGTPVHMDMYMPQKSISPAPVFIAIHGGGWAKGDRASASRYELFKQLVARGFVGVSLEYRLADAKKIFMEDCIIDCKDALRFLHKNAATYGLDENNFVVWGWSAGGHLAMMVALTPDDAFPGDPRLKDAGARVRNAISWFGPSDLSLEDKQSRFDVIAAGGKPAPDLLAKVSPITYAAADNVPLLILQGDADKSVDVEQGRVMFAKGKKLGAPVTYREIANAGHMWKNAERKFIPEFNEITGMTAGFAVQNLDKTAREKVEGNPTK